ncbi:endolytic transglycosylase MltG [Micromonosporaceae bacterium DT55]|uniref:endolytic transglycosylase MltG n=1 Tax=Melissospora conviva TaxID=3388432 RepID=UPI003C26ABCA
MIDELDLEFDDRDAERGEKGRHRHSYVRKRKQKKKKSGRGKTVFALLMTLVLLGGLGGGAWYGYDKAAGFFSTPDYEGGGTEEVTVVIPEGAFLADIGDVLYEAGVVKSAKAFIAEADKNSKAKNIQPGSYTLRKEMKAEFALAFLLDPSNRSVNGITIPEGRTMLQTFKILSEKTGIPEKEFAKAARNPEALGVPKWWFTRNDGGKSVRSIEGFLYPDTYEMPTDVTAEGMLKLMVANFLKVTEGMDFTKTVESERGGISPYEALIVASLAQAEAGTAEDLGKVARVAYNRVYSGTFPCSCLEMDVTVNYHLEMTGQSTKSSGDMNLDDLLDDSHDYSRKLKGLVATPINSPGKHALEAAMKPTPGNWLYFVAIDKQGNSAFTDDYAEHERNQEKARAAGVLK